MHIRHIEEWVSAIPASAEPHRRLGSIYKERGEIDAAIQEYEKAADLSKGEMFEIRDLIDLYLKAGDVPKATALAKRTQSLDGPGGTEGLKYLGQIAGHEGRIDDALAYYEKYYASGSSFGDLDKSYLKLYSDRGDVAGLERALNQQFERTAQSGRAWQSREEFIGNSMKSIELYAQARKYYETAVVRGNVERSLMRSLAGVQEELQDWDAAEKSYRKVLQLDPSDGYTRDSLAEFYIGRKRFADAIRILREDPRARGSSTRGVGKILGQAYIGAGQYKTAIEVLSAAFDSQPSDYDVVFELGRAYELSGDEGAARACYDRYFALTDEYEEKYAADCGCYCSLLQQRKELRARLWANPAEPPAQRW